LQNGKFSTNRDWLRDSDESPSVSPKPLDETPKTEAKSRSPSPPPSKSAEKTPKEVGETSTSRSPVKRGMASSALRDKAKKSMGRRNRSPTPTTPVRLNSESPVSANVRDTRARTPPEQRFQVDNAASGDTFRPYSVYMETEVADGGASRRRASPAPQVHQDESDSGASALVVAPSQLSQTSVHSLVFFSG
jgi:hypothetical protein